MPGPDLLEADVAVVGAGLAGLVAARELLRAGVEPVVVEARERVGGRTLNASIGPAPEQVVELGGQWAGPTQERVLALARELGVATFPTWQNGEHQLERDDRIVRYGGTIPKLKPVALAEVGVAMALLDRMARRVGTEAPWTARGARRLDEQTVATFLRRTLRTAEARLAMRLAVESVWACDPADVSLLHLLFYIRSGGSLDLLLDTEGGAQQDRFAGGSQLLSTRLAEGLGARVRLSAPVRRVVHAAGGVEVEADGVRVRARRAIVALAPPLAGRIAWEPALPPVRDGLTQRMAMGSVIKCHAVYGEPFWRADGLSGHATSLVGPARLFYDNSPPGGRPGVLLSFLEGRAARVAAELSAADRRALVLDRLARLFGERARRPEQFHEQVWAAEPWSGGGYAAVMPPGAWTDHGPALRAPVGTVHWAGTETATRWMGYMDGAVRSGERAAAEVVAALG